MDNIKFGMTMYWLNHDDIRQDKLKFHNLSLLLLKIVDFVNNYNVLGFILCSG